MLILTSDGLSTEELQTQFRKHISPAMTTAAIITTAANPFNERHPDIDRHIEIMERYDIRSECVDIETADPNVLTGYDIIIIIGGNPYYLLKIMQIKNCRPLFHELLASGKIIVGMSAGSMVLGSTIEYVNLLTPQMDVGLDDYSGLSLVDMVICPHASTFVASIEDSAKKLADYERSRNISITRINDGNALFIE